MAHDATESNDAGRNPTRRDVPERNAGGRDERAVESEQLAGSTRSTQSTLRTWAVLALVLGSLVGIPLVVLAETEFGLLSSFGLPRQLTLGVLALVPGFALGGLSLVAMTGWE